jgi:hypothetical protein
LDFKKTTTKKAKAKDSHNHSHQTQPTQQGRWTTKAISLENLSSDSDSVSEIDPSLVFMVKAEGRSLNSIQATPTPTQE